MSSQSFDLIQQIIAVISFFVNILLIFLILAKSPKSLGAYKYLMVLMSVTELGFSIIDFLIKPEVISHGSFLIAGTDFAKSLIPLDVAYPLLLFWGAAYGISVACFGIHFIFRYFMVIGNRKWVSGPWMLLIWFSFPAISGVIYAFTYHWFLPFDENLERIVKSQLDKFHDLPSANIRYLGFSFYKTDPNSEEIQNINWTNSYGIILLAGMGAVSFFTMIYFAVKAHKAIQDLASSCESLSSVAQALQKQLFYSLVVQTIIPMLLIHFPTTVIVLASFTGSGKQIYGDTITMTVSLFPLIDPLPSMIIIKPYRDALRNLILFWRPKSKVHASSTKL